jgi:hypothetical protein
LRRGLDRPRAYLRIGVDPRARDTPCRTSGMEPLLGTGAMPRVRHAREQNRAPSRLPREAPAGRGIGPGAIDGTIIPTTYVQMGYRRDRRSAPAEVPPPEVRKRALIEPGSVGEPVGSCADRTVAYGLGLCRHQ